MEERRPTVWRLKTKPRALSTEARADFIRSMLEDGFVGTGWPVQTDPRSVADALAAVAREYPGKAGQTPRRFISETHVGDLVWIVDSANGNYHLARVDAPYHHERADAAWGAEATHRFAVTWLLKASADETPGGVKNGLRQGNTYCRIGEKAAKAYSRLSAGCPVPIEADACFLDLLDDEALENLVGLYLQHELRGALIPSSAKRSTDGYEFVIRSWDGQRSAVAQVKSGASRPPCALAPVDHEIHLFAIADLDPARYPGATIITRQDLIDFSDAFPNVLPRSISRWVAHCNASGSVGPTAALAA